MKLLKMFTILSILFGCSAKKDTWYAGGTLHKATVIEWQTATNENRLATCADFVANAKKAKGQSYETTEAMKTDAMELMHKINDGYQTRAAEKLKANELAASIMVVDAIKEK